MRYDINRLEMQKLHDATKDEMIDRFETWNSSTTSGRTDIGLERERLDPYILKLVSMITNLRELEYVKRKIDYLIAKQ